MPLSRHARIALGSVLLITVAAVTLPRSGTSHSIRPLAGLVDSPRRERIPEVLSLSARLSAQRAGRTVLIETPPPTPAPPPPPPPAPPTPPPPPTAGGLRLLVDPVTFADHSGEHGGAPATQALAGIMVDVDTRRIIWEVRPHQSLPPASTAKVVSSLVALENFDPHHMITITPDALTQASDETTMGIAAGQQYDVEDLLSGMLTVSANDAATSMA